jgi:triosephosphate isomerase
MKRRKIAAANWKMNLSIEEGKALIMGIRQEVANPNCEIVIAPPLTHLQAISTILPPTMKLGAQNVYHEPSGAYTGEVSVAMVKDLQVVYVIAGHSERRQIFQESNEMIRRKVDAILAGGLTPIFCCGEALDMREAGQHESFVADQLHASLFHLSADEIQRVVIAYEPIWAIGTGVTATTEQAQEMHAYLRGEIAVQYSDDVAQAIPILYGGSIKADNAAAIFSQPDVDGGLVGGASLQVAGFAAIIHACG